MWESTPLLELTLPAFILSIASAKTSGCFILFCVLFYVTIMPPRPKSKGRKMKGAAPTPQPSKNNKRAPRAQVFTEEEFLTDEEVSFPGRQGSLKQQMSHMMGLLSALSDRIKAAETQKSPREESFPVSPSTSTTARTRVRCLSTPTSDHHMSAAVRRKVAKRMREFHLPKEISSDRGLDSDEDQPITHKCRLLKSGLDKTGVTMVVHNITWPHEVVYSSSGKLAVYQELSVPTFVQGYLLVMSGLNTKTRDIMANYL